MDEDAPTAVAAERAARARQSAAARDAARMLLADARRQLALTPFERAVQARQEELWAAAREEWVDATWGHVEPGPDPAAPDGPPPALAQFRRLAEGHVRAEGVLPTLRELHRLDGELRFEISMQEAFLRRPGSAAPVLSGDEGVVPDDDLEDYVARMFVSDEWDDYAAGGGDWR